VRERLLSGARFAAAAREEAWAGQRAWQDELATLFDQVDFLVTPTLSLFPPLIEEGTRLLAGRCTLPVNLAGLPALALPVRTDGPLPASIQLIGPAHSEERLLAAGAALESASAS
jgi:Asp-tRNA(Asn)/Glu-tRNA(Gln) amidotransferase A subunit family amidase